MIYEIYLIYTLVIKALFVPYSCLLLKIWRASILTERSGVFEDL